MTFSTAKYRRPLPPAELATQFNLFKVGCTLGPRQDRVMKTTPLAGYVVIVPSCLCWGEGTPTPSVGAPTVVKDKHLYNKPVFV